MRCLLMRCFVVLSLLLKLEPNNRNNAQLNPFRSEEMSLCPLLAGFLLSLGGAMVDLCPHDPAWHWNLQADLYVVSTTISSRVQ